jgi:probable HAF family extracellular repeat protein
MPFRWKLILFLALCCIMFLGISVFGQDGSPNGKCGFQSLTIPSPAGTTTTPTALNDTGAIVGLLQSGTGASIQHTAFLFSGGKFTHFRFPGSHGTFVYDINKQGVIVGSFDVPTVGGERSFMVHNGVFTKINLPGFPDAPSAAVGINGSGDILGQFSGEGIDNLGYLLHKGELTIISFPGAVGGTFPTGINDQGVVVGTYRLIKDGQPHGFMWQDGNFTTLDEPGPDTTVPVKVSNKGDIIGTEFDFGGVSHGLFIGNGGGFVFIDRPGFTTTQLIAVNSFDNVLGSVTTATGSTVWFKCFCSAVF